MGDAAEGEVLIVFFGELEILFKIAAQHIGQVLPVCTGVGFSRMRQKSRLTANRAALWRTASCMDGHLVFADKAA